MPTRGTRSSADFAPPSHIEARRSPPKIFRAGCSGWPPDARASNVSSCTCCGTSASTHIDRASPIRSGSGSRWPSTAGLPTRLLDWTYSPFVALHFATSHLGSMNEDGVVWTINFVEANKFVPARLKRMMSAEGSDTATVDMLGAFSSLRDFDRLGRSPFVVFLEPPSLDPRIVNQLALFSLMSSTKRDARRLARAAPDAGATRDHSGLAQVGSAGQARSGQRQRARAFPGAGWIEPLADAVLLAEADGLNRATAFALQSSTTEDTEEKSEGTVTAPHETTKGRKTRRTEGRWPAHRPLPLRSLSRRRAEL